MRPLPRDSTNKRQLHEYYLMHSFSSLGMLWMLLTTTGSTAFVGHRGVVMRIPNAHVSATQNVAATRRSYGTNSYPHSRFSGGVLHTTFSDSRLKFHAPNDKGHPSFSALCYRNGNDDLVQTSHEGNDGNASGPVSRWLSSMVKNEPPVDDGQQRVDDYLEFLDKRYNRLHSDDDTASKGETFSVLKWLKEPSDAHEAAEQTDDALYVLGVAGLASERLLQKHHLPCEQREETTEGIPKKRQDCIDAVIESEGEATGILALLDTIQARRRVLLRYQRIKFRAALAFTLQSIANGPRTALSLWRLGGGRKTLALTATAAFAVFLTVRPVLQGLLYEAAYRG